MQFTFVCLAAVSDEQQATEGRDSIPHQLKATREYGERMGGEFIGEYIADGYSRSGYFDLTSAFTNIPEFARLAKDARAHLFDVVLVESFDRFGDLGFNWFNYFASLGAPFIQMRSVQQPLPIEDPATYHPRRDDSTTMMLGNSAVINKYRTNKIFRAFEIGSARRARDGKYSRRLPFGYKQTGTKKDYKVELDPLIKAALIDIKDKYLSGWTLRKLAAYLDETYHIRTSHNHIGDIFANPHYAGKVTYNRGYIDPKTKTWKAKGEPIELFDGQHEAVWDVDTYRLLVSELERRNKYMHNIRAYPLTGLVVCERCDGNHMHINPADPSNYLYYNRYRCRRCNLYVREEYVVDEFVKSLSALMAEHGDVELSQPAPVDNTKAIAALNKQMDKIRVAYETTDSYTAEEYAQRKRDIAAEIARLQDAEYQRELQLQGQQQQADAFRFVRDALPHIRDWITNAPAEEVSVTLSRFIRAVVVAEDKSVRVELR